MIKTDSSKDMLAWQLKTLLGEVQQIELHETGDCPCLLNTLEPQENCLGKHLLNISTLSNETANMSSQNAEWLSRLAEEANERHEKYKKYVCHKDDLPVLTNWAREWRKRYIEPVYYACSAKKAHVRDVMEAMLRESKSLRIPGKVTPDSTSFTVSSTERVSATAGLVKELAQAIEQVSQQVAAKGKPGAGAVSNKTFAFGITTPNRYIFEWCIVDIKDLVVSHNAWTFQLNPKYIAKLQPRKRERAACQLQVRKITSILDPKQLLIDTHTIDADPPIIGDSDNLVECGNGRIIAMLIAAKQHPDRIVTYKKRLKEIASLYDLPTDKIDKMALPVLVRARLAPMTMKQRQAFAEECNAPITAQASAVEKAGTDAEKITSAMLTSLDILEDDEIEDALRSPRNKQFVTAFLSKLPENEQTALVDAKGVLNTDGLRRMVMAIFVATFPGETGLRLASQFFESIKPEVRIVLNGLLRVLGNLAKVEVMTAKNERLKEYAIGEDLAKAISVYGSIRKVSGMTVEKYLAQQQLEARELSPFQERLQAFLDEKPRSAKRIAAVLNYYATLVLESPPPGQAGLMGSITRATKEQLFEQAVRKAEAVPRRRG